ncbi:MAG: hypothetical protein IPP94_13145 [Ignavibacteria bacterium]|nr:hypothetical protein [Ignavibacteria bacterium]
MTRGVFRSVLILAACLLAAHARALGQDTTYSKIGILVSAGLGTAGGTGNEEAFLRARGFAMGRGDLLPKRNGTTLLIAADYRITKRFAAGLAFATLGGYFTEEPNLYAFRQTPDPYVTVKSTQTSDGYYLYGAWYILTTPREDHSPNVRIAAGIGASRIAVNTSFGDDWNAVWTGDNVAKVSRAYTRPSAMLLVTAGLPLGPALSIGASVGYRYVTDLDIAEETVAYPVKYPDPRTVRFTMPAHTVGYSSSMFGGYLELRL